MSRIMPMSEVSPVPLAASSYAVEDDDGAIYVPVIEVFHPGQGEGGRFLDSLPTDRTVKVPGVMSAVLAGMLVRRGFRPTLEWAPNFREDVEVYVREPGG